MKKTVIIGASTNASRYSYLATQMLQQYGHEIVPVGIKKGEIHGKTILDLRQKPDIRDVDTVTLYIGPHNQPEWIPYLLGLHPRRIIFNPGSENEAFETEAAAAGIEVVEGCTLVMLRSKQF
jgi:uncharacterized protein